MNKLCGEMGEYKNNITINTPSWWKSNKDKITFDPCIQDEILELIYKYNIRTINSCCGHGNLELASVILAQYDITRMLELGYQQFQEFDGEFRPDIFHLKYKPLCQKDKNLNE